MVTYVNSLHVFEQWYILLLQKLYRKKKRFSLLED